MTEHVIEIAVAGAMTTLAKMGLLNFKVSKEGYKRGETKDA